MGRPISKRLIGNPELKNSSQIFVDANVGQGIERCFIVKQRSTSRFLVESINSGNQLTIQLVDNPLKANTPGFGVIEIGLFDSPLQVDTMTVVNSGIGYSVTDVLTVIGGIGTPATINVGSILPADGDETLHTNFEGGSGYNIGDIITLSVGSVITVDAVSSGVVTEFTLDSSNFIFSYASNNPIISQSTTSGSGTGFRITLTTPGQRIASAFAISPGAYSVEPTNPVSHTGGTGTGATFNLRLTFDQNEYVRKLRNRSAIIHGSGNKETFSVNRSIPGTTRNIHGK